MTIAEQLLARGKAEGKAEGELEGAIQDKRQVLLRLLQKRFGKLSESARRTIAASKDRDRLDRALDLVLDASSTEQVLEAFR